MHTPNFGPNSLFSVHSGLAWRRVARNRTESLVTSSVIGIYLITYPGSLYIPYTGYHRWPMDEGTVCVNPAVFNNCSVVSIKDSV